MALAIGEEYVLEDIEIDFSLDRIMETPPFPAWAGARYARERLESLIDSHLTSVRSAIDARAAYGVLETDGSGIAAHSPPAQLERAEFVTPVLATAGEFDGHLGADPAADELVRDALENVALTLVKERVGTQILTEAQERGWKTTRLYSPGSGNGGWPISAAAFIFDVLPADEIGMGRTPEGYLDPPKSVGTVIGLGPSVEQVPDIFTCAGCDRIPECDYARSTDEAVGVS